MCSISSQLKDDELVVSMMFLEGASRHCHVTHVTLFVRVGEAKGGAVGANEDELPHTICAAII